VCCPSEIEEKGRSKGKRYKKGPINFIRGRGRGRGESSFQRGCKKGEKRVKKEGRKKRLSMGLI